MLRNLLLYLSRAPRAQTIISQLPLARRVAHRFVAGEQLEDAITVAKSLQQAGIKATLDYLGESITRAEDTEAVVTTYQKLVERIQAENLDASISLKPTHLGYDISEELCMVNLRHILTAAKTHQVQITIDMESSAYTDATLRMYRTLRDEYDFDNVGTVIQAYLYRSEKDMRDLAEEQAHIRLCKGAYLESPEIAFPEKAEVDDNFSHLTDLFLEQKTGAYLCIATHDENMIRMAQNSIVKHDVNPDCYEFQMLYGIRTDRQHELAREHTMRVYVPFGEAWYPYFVRRLAERPANLWFFTRHLFG